MKEKAYRDYGHDLDATDTLLEAGLSFTCDLEKEGGFVGMEHIIQQRAESKQNGGLKRKMAQLVVDDSSVLLHHGEIVWRDGQRISDIRSASYGHSLKGAVGLTMVEASADDVVNKNFISSGDWEVEIADKKYPCRLSFAPMYDPKNVKIKV